MLRPMVVSIVAVDQLTKSPIVILKEIDGERTLPIWIGLLEAQAIASEMEGVKYFRPMTHDLLINIFDMIEVKVNRIEVCDLKENTFYALIHITHNNTEIAVDARPSDAMAISLRAGAPIFVADEVINKSKQLDTSVDPMDKSEKGKKWVEILQSIDPKDFGNT